MTEAHAQPVTRRLAWAVVASFGVSFVFALAVMLWSQAAIRTSEETARQGIADSQHKWCALLIPLDEGYKVTPPATASGKQFASIIHSLRVDFGC